MDDVRTPQEQAQEALREAFWARRAHTQLVGHGCGLPWFWFPRGWSWGQLIG